jgi:arsenite methyltransferase
VSWGWSCSVPSACCGSSTNIADSMSQVMGYSKEVLSGVVEGANLGLGCGHPTAIGNLKEGEIVLDLGSGGGFDCFLAAKKVGDRGHVIGVDMTAEMLAKACKNAAKMGTLNVEFRYSYWNRNTVI